MGKNITRFTFGLIITIVVAAHMVFGFITLLGEMSHDEEYTYVKGYCVNTELAVGDEGMGFTALYKSKFSYQVDGFDGYFYHYVYTPFKATYKVGDAESFRVSKINPEVLYKNPTTLLVTCVVELMVCIFGVLVVVRSGSGTKTMDTGEL